MKNGSNEHFGRPACSLQWYENSFYVSENFIVLFTHVLHLRGRAKPSKPGFTFKFGITSLHERHWIDMVVALALIPDADTIIPAIFTKRDTLSDFAKLNRK